MNEFVMEGGPGWRMNGMLSIPFFNRAMASLS